MKDILFQIKNEWFWKLEACDLILVLTFNFVSRDQLYKFISGKWVIGVFPKWRDFHWIQRIWEITEAWIGFSIRVCYVKNCPQLGLNSQSSVLCSTNWPREESVRDFWSKLSFVSCTTSHVGLCLFLESIEHDFIKALLIHTHNQIVT